MESMGNGWLLSMPFQGIRFMQQELVPNPDLPQQVLKHVFLSKDSGIQSSSLTLKLRDQINRFEFAFQTAVDTKKDYLHCGTS